MPVETPKQDIAARAEFVSQIATSSRWRRRREQLGLLPDDAHAGHIACPSCQHRDFCFDQASA
jgi:hypothetical protein